MPLRKGETLQNRAAFHARVDLRRGSTRQMQQGVYIGFGIDLQKGLQALLATSPSSQPIVYQRYSHRYLLLGHASLKVDLAGLLHHTLL